VFTFYLSVFVVLSYARCDRPSVRLSYVSIDSKLMMVPLWQPYCVIAAVCFRRLM